METEGRAVKDAKAAKRKVGRPATGISRPVATFRMHEALYDRLVESAKRLNVSFSEEAERRLQQAFEWETQLGELKTLTARHEKMLKAGFETALRQKGYTPILGVEGRFWAEPGTELTGKFTALHPTIVQAIEEAMLRVIKREKGEGGEHGERS
jgi:hypothetical protein